MTVRLQETSIVARIVAAVACLGVIALLPNVIHALTLHSVWDPRAGLIDRGTLLILCVILLIGYMAIGFILMKLSMDLWRDMLRRVRGAIPPPHRDPPPPFEYCGAPVPVGPRHPSPLEAHAIADSFDSP